jgi:hypothetical protein
MCTGAEWVAVASAMATAGGTAASISANKSRRRASEAAAYNELQKHEGINKESQQLFQDQLASSDPALARREAEQAAAEEYAASQQLVGQNEGFTAATETPGLATASPVVKDAAARSLADELSKAESQMKARSVLTGLGLQRKQRMNQLGRTAERFDMLQNFGADWSRVGQTQQQLAQNAGANKALLGDLLTGVGGIGMSAAGAAGGFSRLFGGAAAGSSGLKAPGLLEGATKLGPGSVNPFGAAAYQLPPAGTPFSEAAFQFLPR